MTDLLDATNIGIGLLEQAMETPAQKWLRDLRINKTDEEQVSDLDKAADARAINREGRDVMGINNRGNYNE